jgi:ABC-2 type transport system ATP-binding protein
VLLPSHLLREMEVIADHLVVIGGGRILAGGTRQELVAGTGGLEDLYLRLTAGAAGGVAREQAARQDVAR